MPTAKTTQATKKATKAQDQYNESAKTVLSGILGRLSPELAGLANVAVDLAKGLGHVSAALLCGACAWIRDGYGARFCPASGLDLSPATALI